MFVIGREIVPALRLGSAIRKISNENKIKTGVVMLNMGGPQNTDQVHDFLLRVMTDREMIQFPFMQNTIGPWIAKRRTSYVQKKYEEIGGGSPVLKWTERQGALLCKRLDEISAVTGPHKHYVAFRYVPPFTQEAIEQAEKDGIERLVIFSQYPQYSCATSGCSFNEIYKVFQKRKVLASNMKLSVIDRWSTHPLLARTFAHIIEKELEHFPVSKRKDVVILFSAHSLPLKTVSRGDSYPSEVGATVQAIVQELNYSNPYQLVWQSKVGPLPWLGPFTGDSMKAYVLQGKKNFILVPVAFVNEHLETLHEMDIEYCKDLADEIGVEQIQRAATPNDHPMFIEALADIVYTHLNSSIRVSPKFLNRCPHCTNATCYNSKKWYADVCST